MLFRLICWPFTLAARIIGGVLSATGRFVAFLLGLALCAVGAVLCVTIIGLVLGLPLCLLGFGMMIRAIF